MFFHPPDERGEARENRIRRAKSICRACPVIDQCLAHALRIPEPYGIWGGGMSEDERAELLGVQSLLYPARVIPQPPVRSGTDDLTTSIRS